MNFKTLMLFFYILHFSALAKAETFSILNLDEISNRAQNILCEMTYCLSTQAKSNTSLSYENYKNYLGYYHIHENRISVNPHQSDVSQLLTLVHEYIHVYRSQFNAHEETWLSEGLAKFIEFKASGVWPIKYQDQLHNSSRLIFENSEDRFTPGGPGYADAFWLVFYLHKHFGGDGLIKKLLESRLAGWQSILAAITELSALGTINITSDLINQNSILRHFAIALILNDQFAAKYSLFYIDQNFIPLRTTKLNLNASTPHQKSQGRKIIISQNKAEHNATEIHVIKSLTPLVIETQKPGTLSIGLFYISIF